MCGFFLSFSLDIEANGLLLTDRQTGKERSTIHMPEMLMQSSQNMEARVLER